MRLKIGGKHRAVHRREAVKTEQMKIFYIAAAAVWLGMQGRNFFLYCSATTKIMRISVFFLFNSAQAKMMQTNN